MTGGRAPRGKGSVYDWLEGRDALILKADRKESVVVLRIGLTAEIAVAAEQGKGGAR